MLLGCWVNSAPDDGKELLQKMQEALPYSVGRGFKFQTCENISFGRVSSQYDNEESHEADLAFLPQEQLLFVGQGRIDNNTVINSQLDSDKMRSCPVDNSILKAYLKWGKDCVNHLRGDWSFAIFDFVTQELFLARDPLGYTSIFYYQDNTGFYFGSSLKSLLQIPSFHKQLNELHFVRNLTLWDHTKTDQDTYFKGVHSLPVAHTLSVSNAGFNLRKYWHPLNTPFRFYKKKQDYAEEMRDFFYKSVRSRLKSAKPVAAMLSGGLDSSAVSFVAAELLKQDNKILTTFSHVPLFTSELATDIEKNRRQLDERPLIQAVAEAAGNIRPVFLNSADYSIIRGLKESITIFDEPLHGAGNLYWLLELYSTVAQQGYGALLSGEGGNGSISFAGINYLLPWSINRIINRPLKFLKVQVAKPIAIKYFNRMLYKRIRGVESLENYISGMFTVPGIIEKYNILSDILMNKKEIVEYTPNIQLQKKLFTDLYSSRAVLGAQIGHHYGFELRDPTTDVDLMEYFFSIPNEVFFDGHYNNRMLVKRMMKGSVPDKVLFEKKKGLQSADLAYRAKAQAAEISATIQAVQHSAAANHYIDTKSLWNTWQTYLQQPYVSPHQYQRLLKALHFAMFLQMNFD